MILNYFEEFSYNDGSLAKLQLHPRLAGGADARLEMKLKSPYGRAGTLRAAGVKSLVR